LEWQFGNDQNTIDHNYVIQYRQGKRNEYYCAQNILCVQNVLHGHRCTCNARNISCTRDEGNRMLELTIKTSIIHFDNGTNKYPALLGYDPGQKHYINMT
jgi:hypothetical protein